VRIAAELARSSRGLRRGEKKPWAVTGRRGTGGLAGSGGLVGGRRPQKNRETPVGFRASEKAWWHRPGGEEPSHRRPANEQIRRCSLWSQIISIALPWLAPTHSVWCPSHRSPRTQPVHAGRRRQSLVHARSPGSAGSCGCSGSGSDGKADRETARCSGAARPVDEQPRSSPLNVWRRARSEQPRQTTGRNPAWDNIISRCGLQTHLLSACSVVQACWLARRPVHACSKPSVSARS